MLVSVFKKELNLLYSKGRFQGRDLKRNYNKLTHT